MAEEGQTQTTTDEPQKFAGKYETPEALETGLREIRGSLGFTDDGDKPIYGEGGIFTDISAAERAYKEYETLLRSRGAPQPKQSSGEAKPEGTPSTGLGIDPAGEAAPDDNVGIDEILQKSNLDAAELVKNFSEKGELTTDQYKAIQKARPGLSKKIINTIIRGEMAQFQAMEAQAQAARQKAIESLGGEQQHNALRQWASENMDAAELQQLGALVQANPNFYPTMMEIVASRHKAAAGASGARPIVTGDAPATGGNMPSNLAEFTALADKAADGDQSAIATLKRIPMSQIAQWS